MTDRKLLEAAAKAVPFLDCRTCAHFTRKSGGCMSVVQCVNGDRFVATRPHQYWEAAPEVKESKSVVKRLKIQRGAAPARAFPKKA